MSSGLYRVNILLLGTSKRTDGKLFDVNLERTASKNQATET